MKFDLEKGKRQLLITSPPPPLIPSYEPEYNKRSAKREYNV